jgi:hypothetical protein
METFKQILARPVWDGDLISKAERDLLKEAGFIDRGYGFNYIATKGVEAAVALGLLRRGGAAPKVNDKFDQTATESVTLDDLDDAEKNDLFDEPALTPHGRRIDLGSGLFADAEDFANRRYLGLPVLLYETGGTVAGRVDGPCSKADYARYVEMEERATGVPVKRMERIVAHANIHPGIR